MGHVNRWAEHAVEMATKEFAADHPKAARHAHLGITSIYLQGIDTREIVETVHHRRPPGVAGD